MAQLKIEPDIEKMRQTQQKVLPNGPAAAALLSAGLACLAFGLLATLAAAFPPLTLALQWYQPTGELSGESTLAVGVWLVCWFVLARRWQHRQVHLTRILLMTLIFLALGLIGTFPPFFGVFAS